MSTVLWANVCVDGQVVSDQQDCHALCRHAEKLDAIARDLGVASFNAACDDTDARYQLDDDLELPAGMASTSDVMLHSGAWIGVQEADRMLDALLARIREQKIRFGLLKNQHEAVVEELAQVLAFLRSQPKAEKFNLAVVM